jgi:cytochrome c
MRSSWHRVAVCGLACVGIFWLVEAAIAQGSPQFSARNTPHVAAAATEPGFAERFRKVRLVSALRAPMELAVAPGGRVFVAERDGQVLVYDPDNGETREIGRVSVATTGEHGLLGLALDPDFVATGWIYLAYSHGGESGVDVRLSRFTVNGAVLDSGSERVMLSVPFYGGCCHAAGALVLGPEGDLYFSTGDDTNYRDSQGYAPIDERPGRDAWDAQKSSSNTMDLRGKILRIRPRAEGGYTIPPGNLFPVGGGRPEIYAMGMRNPFRFSIDPRTGWLYFGDVGPDAAISDPARGPRGYDEINRVRTAGNYGWPYCIADNQPYIDYDYGTGLSGAAFDCVTPTNDSPNNSGSLTLPPARPALIWYPYADSPEFPQLGTGGRTALAGPVYRRPADTSRRAFPSYYDGDLFIYDWTRNWIKTVRFNGRGQPVKLIPFGSQWEFWHPIDMEFADGALYVLDWGRNLSQEGGLFKIDYRAPSGTGMPRQD